MRISIASGKGGTGKTTLSTNLASFLAEKQQVALIDIDVEEPNSKLFIDGELVTTKEMTKAIPQWEAENCTLCGFCQQSCNFNAIMRLGEQIMVFPQLCHSCYLCSELCPSQSLPMVSTEIGVLTEYKNGNLSFIESKLKIGEEQAVPLIKQTIDYTNEILPHIPTLIFDCPPGTSCPVIEATRHADLVILVTEPTPFGLHDLKLAVETMRSMDKDFGVVINRDGIGNNETEEYCQSEKIQIVAKIPNKREIAIAYSDGQLLYKVFPEVEKALSDIEKFIAQKSPSTI